MSVENNDLMMFIQERIKKHEGVAVPIKASLFEVLFVKKVSGDRLYPNPDDEFSKPEVGPNYQIINDYRDRIRRGVFWGGDPGDEPLIVEKVHPDGYMILNGHHRWIAAKYAGLKKIPVSIVNLPNETDIKKMISHSKHERRAVFDLDEVVFTKGENAEDSPRRLFVSFNERIRLGMPALAHYLAKKGYDIWVYSSEFYSLDHIKRLFKAYHIPVTGIVTGTRLNNREKSQIDKSLEKSIMERYPVTLNITNGDLVCIERSKKDYVHHEFDCPENEWAKTVMKLVGELEKPDGE